MQDYKFDIYTVDGEFVDSCDTYYVNQGSSKYVNCEIHDVVHPEGMVVEERIEGCLN